MILHVRADSVCVTEATMYLPGIKINKWRQEARVCDRLECCWEASHQVFTTLFCVPAAFETARQWILLKIHCCQSKTDVSKIMFSWKNKGMMWKLLLSNCYIHKSINFQIFSYYSYHSFNVFLNTFSICVLRNYKL